MQEKCSEAGDSQGGHSQISRDDEGLDQGRDGAGREETVELTALDNW